MRRVVEGSLARRLDYDEVPPPPVGPPVLCLARGSDGVRGPDKYLELHHRRHQAQIRARRLLNQAEETSS
jgi:hypothetical protein